MCVTLCTDQISNYGFKNISAYVLSGSLYDLETINEIIKLMWKLCTNYIDMDQWWSQIKSL
jgi:hypothetical protein